jgi:hypothetical protein
LEKRAEHFLPESKGFCGGEDRGWKMIQTMYE